MKRWWILAFAVAVLAGTASAGDPPRVELPLGPYVRPGRPLGVRVIGGADRVRAPGTPWALPQGERGDEFILQLTDATVGVLSLEIDRGGRVERVSQTVETLPADAVVVGVRGDGEVPAGARALRLPGAGLPTVTEGWLLLDDVADGVASAGVTEVLRFLRKCPPLQRAMREPMLGPPDPAVFVAGAKIAAWAPRLPADVVTLLLLLAAAESVVLVILRFRDATPWRRAAWLGLPPLAALVFVAMPGRLPGALSATAFAVDAPGRVVFVRVEARRDGSARFVLPPGETGAAMIRFSADDATVADASAGREVLLDLRAGESRAFVYVTGDSGPFDSPMEWVESVTRTNPNAPPLPAALVTWLEGRGFEVRPSRMRFSTAQVPRAEGTVVIPVAGASAVAPTK